MVFTGRKATTGTQLVREARDFLFENSHEYDKAIARFKWPELTEFNFALEWFDVVAGEYPDRAAVTIVSADLSSKSWSYAELAIRSDQVANWLLSIGIKRGDHLLVMLNNTIELWEIMLGIAKIGAVSVPTSTLLSATDLEYRAEKGEAAAIIALSSVADRAQLLPENVLRIAVTPGVSDSVPAGWIEFAESLTAAARFEPTEPTPADDTCLLYFTSGTTKKPKLVQHTQVSYPVGHLSTMWWLGLREGDVHLNISSPGWAKHA